MCLAVVTKTIMKWGEKSIILSWLMCIVSSLTQLIIDTDAAVQSGKQYNALFFDRQVGNNNLT